jgi:hypothetical protein
MGISGAAIGIEANERVGESGVLMGGVFGLVDYRVDGSTTRQTSQFAKTSRGNSSK